jgi:hypothetical protein
MVLAATLFEQSIAKANEIFNRSENLTNAGADARKAYVERIPYLTNLLGKEGHVSFHPYVTKDLTIDFRNVMENELRKAHDEYYYKNHPTREEGRKVRHHWILTSTLFDYTTNDDLLQNKVPYRVREEIEHHEIEGFNSPKLSKMLVKLYGEQSDVVKWFTNKCPKKLESGLNEDYKVHVSILPHHIAGMSYYAPFNWGGDRWITGWNYTSCMDTIRNSDGDTIYKLVPNLMDGTLAIAYLTTADNDDLFEPRYLARLLIRVAKVNENDHVMVGLRAFYTNNETKNILIEGLKSEFENFVHVEDLRMRYDMDEYEKFITPMGVTWEVEESRETCEYCDGTGEDDWGDDCEECDGRGYNQVYGGEYRPYVDDADVLAFKRNAVIIKLPIDYLVEKGYMEKPQEEVFPIFEGAFAC